MALVEEMFRRFMARQPRFFKQLPEDAKRKLADIENKYAELRVTGPEGGVLYFQYKEQSLHLLDEQPPVPYDKLDKFTLDGDIYNYPSGDEVLFDVVDGSLSPRAAVSREYFRPNNRSILYTMEVFAQAFEEFLDEMRKVLGVGSAH